MAEHVDDGDVDDGLELPEQQVRQHGAEYRGEVAEHREGVVDHLQANKTSYTARPHLCNTKIAKEILNFPTKKIKNNAARIDIIM
jgi:hypothetical protein